MDGEALSDLLARVEAAEGADRELDGAIECGWRNRLARDPTSWKHHPRADGSLGPYVTAGGFSGVTAPAYTASLDASLALVERVLPGWDYRVERDDGAHKAGVWKAGTYFGGYGVEAAKTSALALLAALLRALIAESATAVPVNEQEGNTAARPQSVFASNGDSNAEPSGAGETQRPAGKGEP